MTFLTLLGGAGPLLKMGDLAHQTAGQDPNIFKRLHKWSFISLRNLWISVFDVVLLKVELEMWFFAVSEIKSAWKLQFSSKSMLFSSKSAVFIKICSFHQNLQFSSKSVVFIKIRGFHQNPQFSSKSTVFAISLWAFKRTTSNVKWKTTCLER